MTTTFIETQFPQQISYGSNGGSGFNTTIFETSSGYEQRNVNWSKSRGKWDVSHAIKSSSDMEQLISFFMAMNGRAYGFRFKDWADYQVANQYLGTATGTQTVFQLLKNYADPLGIQQFVRVIQKPVLGSLTMLTLNGSPVAPSTYTLDYTTGIITFNTPPTSGQQLYVQYIEFDVPARFDTDDLNVKQEFWTYSSWESIPIVEIRV